MVFKPGERVRSIGLKRTGYVIESSADLTKVVFSGESAPELVATDSLEQIPEHSTELLDPVDFLNQLTAYKLTSQLSDVIYGYLASRTQFRPYQFLPVLRFLESPVRRLLIADEVGLGKTIEAGLIWLELLARQQADRVLVVCPSQLKEKWRRELLTRFDIDATVINAGKELDEVIYETIETPELAGRPRNLIVSVDTLARECRLMDTAIGRAEALAMVGIVWDLVVFDEAHHARNPTTMRHHAIEALTTSADAQIFLTATPLNLGQPDLFYLLRLLAPDRFQSLDAFQDELEPAKHVTRAVRAARESRLEVVLSELSRIAKGRVGKRVQATPAFREAESLARRPNTVDSKRDLALLERSLKDLHPLSGVFTRTRKRDLTEPFAKRTVGRVDVAWTPEEREFYDSLIHAARSGGGRNPFAVVMPARQSASCLPAMKARLRDSDLSYDSEEGLEQRHSYTPDWFTNASADARRRLTRAITQLDDSVDTKFDAFLQKMRTLFDGEVGQALIFSFFKGTIRYLRRRLIEEGFTVEAIHGDVSLDERYRLMDRFRDGDFQILLSTEVGAEGLDFEFCPCLVNYDLPWNPMRVEQRIGRLDRFGQIHEKIVIVNFKIPGTIETDIFERLYERIGVFTDSIGDLDDILGDEMEERAFALIADLQLTPRERERQLEELALAFERKRAQVEDLDSHRELLAASEELLADEFQQLRAKGRVVDATEVEPMVKQYFSSNYPNTRWEQRDDDTEIVTFDQRLCEDGPLRNVLNEQSVRHIRDRAFSGTPVLCTFNGERASRDHHIEFFTTRHPLVQAIAEQVTPDNLPIEVSAALTTDGLPPGNFFVAIYESVIRSIGTRKSLFCIAVDSETGERRPYLEEHLLGLLPRLVQDMRPTGTRPKMPSQLRSLASEERIRIEENALIESELLYERRRRAVEATHEPKVRAAQARLERTRGSRIEQANVAQLRNHQQRYESELRELETAKQPEVTLRDVAFVALAVEPATADGFARKMAKGRPSGEPRLVEAGNPPLDKSQRVDSTPTSGPSTYRSLFCSSCDPGNSVDGYEELLPASCSGCGQEVLGNCPVCERLITREGCRVRITRSSFSRVRLESITVERKFKNGHFTPIEVDGIISGGAVRTEVWHRSGQTLPVDIHAYGSAEVAVHAGTIVDVRRITTD